MPKKSAVAERYENEAARIRRRHGFSYAEPINPFAFADSLGLKVIEPTDIPEISEQDLARLDTIGADWSGLSFSLSDNRIIVILNSSHEQPRKRITLMEEICHFLYHHKPKVKVHLIGPERINFLDFTRQDEKDAYWIAAAILVPYKALKSLIIKRKTCQEIAAHFEVSQELIRFRINVTGLFNLYNEMQKVAKLLRSF